VSIGKNTVVSLNYELFGDNGELIRVQPFERVLGFPPVRLELKF